MDELIDVMNDILDELRGINRALNDLTGAGQINLAEIKSELQKIQNALEGE